MRHVVVRLLCAILACPSTWSRASFAASVGLGVPSGANLAVERGPGAEDCPDATALSARIAGIRGEDDTHATTVYVVGFKRTGTVFSATIRAGGTSMRILSARGQTCSALAQATAVTLAMLIDSDEAAERPPLSATEPKPRPEPTAVAVPELAVPVAPNTHITVGLSLGAAALAGVLGSIAPALVADGELGVRRLRVGVASACIGRRPSAECFPYAATC